MVDVLDDAEEIPDAKAEAHTCRLIYSRKMKDSMNLCGPSPSFFNVVDLRLCWAVLGCQQPRGAAPPDSSLCAYPLEIFPALLGKSLAESVA